MDDHDVSLSMRRLLQSMRVAAQAAAAGEVRQFTRRMSDCLSELSEAFGASRACLCLFGGRDDEIVVADFMSGGLEHVLALGPHFLGVRLADVPEWQLAFDHGQRCLVNVGEASPVLRSALEDNRLDWVITTPLANERGAIAALSLVGRGGVIELDSTSSMIMDTLAELLAAVLWCHRSTTAERALIALDLIELGVVWIDMAGRVKLMNATAERALGATFGELCEGVLRPSALYLRLEDGQPLRRSDLLEQLDAGHGRYGPVAVQLRNLSGRPVRALLTVEYIHLSTAVDRSAYMVILDEKRDAIGPSDGGGGSAGRSDTALEIALEQVEDGLNRLQRLGRINSRSPDHSGTLAGISLSPRESEVVELLLQGMRVSTISRRLYLSPHTVRNHLKGAFRKVGVHSQAALIDAIHKGEIDPRS